jgi:hypothetical protein
MEFWRGFCKLCFIQISVAEYTCVPEYNAKTGGNYSFPFCFIHSIERGYAVAQLGETLGFKPEGRGFDSRWSYWNFSVT